jgi:inorganic pyrophosphatase
MPKILCDQLEHFFAHYKDLEEGKWVKVKRWGEAQEAFELVRQGMERVSQDKD